MAEQYDNQDDRAEALEAMAADSSDAQRDPLEPGDPCPTADAREALASLAAGDTAQAQGENSDDAGPLRPGADESAAGEAVLVPTEGTRGRARRQSLQRNAERAQLYHFERMMIPLLVVMAAVLLILSGITAALLLTSPAGASGQTSQISRHGPLLIAASCPLAGVLLLGAWLLHLDICRKTGRRQPTTDEPETP